nr:unnamed protein product [Callosobruchus analis]
MEVNRLLGDELTYELQVRELPIGNTVAEKRMLLREALRMERQNLKTFPGKCTAPVELELDICSKKLSELRADVASFDSDNRRMILGGYTPGYYMYQRDWPAYNVPPPNEALDDQLRNCSLLDDKQATETVYRRSAPPPDAYRRCEAQTTDRDRYSLPTSSLWKGNVAHPYPKYDDCNPIPLRIIPLICSSYFFRTVPEVQSI